ncbi:hypothetical protein Tco_1423388 [Tanacetum coccineum]
MISILVTPRVSALAGCDRKNRVLQDMINAMLVSENLPKNLWSEALLTACHMDALFDDPTFMALSPIQMIEYLLRFNMSQPDPIPELTSVLSDFHRMYEGVWKKREHRDIGLST